MKKKKIIKQPPKIKKEFNELGYLLNDPYGLVAAFINVIPPMTVFGKNK